MKYQTIQSFQGINKAVHPRMLPDNKLYDCKNVIFKDNKVKNRWGYTELGSNLPLSGALLSLGEFTLLRSDENNLIAITENSTYEYNETSGEWDEIIGIYNTGTIDQIGSETNFNAAATEGCSVCKLDSTHIAVAFRDVGDSEKGYAMIGVIDGSTITFGSEYEFSSTATYDPVICAIDSTTIAVAYRSGKARIGTIANDDEITFGTESTFEASGTVYYFSICPVDSTHIAVVYQDNADSSKGKGIIGTFSGTTISGWGSEYEFNAATTYYTSVCKLDSTHIAVAFREASSDYGKAIIGIISGTTITFGSEYTFESDQITFTSICTIDSTHIAIAYKDSGDSNYGKAIIGVIANDDEITFGSEYTFNSGTTNTFLLAICLLDSTHIAIAYQDASDSDYGKAIIGTIANDDEITFGNEFTFNAGDSEYIAICAIDEYTLAIAYMDDADSDYGKIVCPSSKYVYLSGGTWSTSWPENSYQIKFGTDEIDGTGSPDTWFVIADFETTARCLLSTYAIGCFKTFSSEYIITQNFYSTDDDYFDTCNIIEGLGASDEKQYILTNGVDPIKLYDGTTMGTLDMTGDGGSAPIDTAKYCAYYYGHLLFAWCNDTTNDLPQTVYWSRRGYPTYWDSSLGQGAGYQDLIVNDDDITGMEVLKQRLFVFKERSIVECYYTGYTDPAFEFIENRVKNIGASNGRTIINIGEIIFFKGEDNIYSFNGLQPVAIGEEIIEYIKSIEDTDYSYKSYAARIEKEFLYILFIATSSTTWTPVAYNYKKNEWTIWDLANELNCFGVYDDDIVLGDESGNVYLMDLTETDDNGTDIDCYIETKDYPLNNYKHAFRLLETILTTETYEGELQISCSVDFGDNWSEPIVIDQDTDDSIYEQVQNWFQLGEQVRFKIENIDGSQFAFESLMIGFEEAGISIRR